MRNRILWKKKKFFLITLLYVVIIFIFTVLLFGNCKEGIKQAKLVDTINKKTYAIQDAELYNYVYKENKLISQNNDGQVVIKNINSLVSNVEINSDDKSLQKCIVSLYYTDGNEQFSQEKVLTKRLKKNQKKITFQLNRKIRNVRIDFGSRIGQEIFIQNIKVGMGKVNFSWRRLYQYFKNIVFHSHMFWVRFVFVMLFFLYLGLHFIFDVKKMYYNIFKYRWILGIGIVLILSFFEIHGDSMAMYDVYVQPGQGSEFVNPVFGVPRAIRSDEWVVDTPSIFASSYGDKAYGKYNEILRGGDTLNIAGGIYLGFSTIGKNPTWFIYKILGVKKGFCFCWNFRIIFSWLICVELFYILTRRKKLISIFGGTLIVSSSYFLWWGFPIFIASSISALVCIYYFLIARSKKTKILYALGVAVATANFIDNLYPAWQVPVAYIIIAFLVWFVHDYWFLIKKMDKKDWTIFLGALVLCISLVVTFLYDSREYTSTIMQTVYPGRRFDNGSFVVNKLMYYGQSMFYAIKDVGNASENGVFFSLFPLPMILAVIQQIRAKHKDLLTCNLLIVSLFLLIYTTVGLPGIIAKVTLMNFSTAGRAVDILGFVNVILLVLVLGRNRKKFNAKSWIALVIAVFLASFSIWICNKYYPGYLNYIMDAISMAIIVGMVFLLLAKMPKKLQNTIMILLIIVQLGSGMIVRPVMKGFDAYYSKPLSKEIQKIVSESSHDLWITVNEDIVLQSYAVACGAPTLNSVNLYPKLEMWKKIDPNGYYNDIYNRYAHITVDLVEDKSSIDLIQADWVKIHLAYSDLSKLNIKYILSRNELNSTTDILLKKVYQENGIYIYSIN